MPTLEKRLDVIERHKRRTVHKVFNPELARLLFKNPSERTPEEARLVAEAEAESAKNNCFNWRALDRMILHAEGEAAE